jgi:hypothetical protein
MGTSYSETARIAQTAPFFGGAINDGPANYSVGLFTGDPNSTTSPGVECTGVGYARIPMVNDAAAWVVAPGSQSRIWRLGVDLIWTASAGVGWGRPDWVCFFDAATGLKIFAVNIDNPITVDAGQPMRVLTGQMTHEVLN